MSRLAIVVAADGAKSYQYVESYEVAQTQVDPTVAGYDPLGATSTEGCANCNWFIAPGRCVVVSGDISPTGHSSLWRAKEAAVVAPVLVQIVDGPTPSTKDASTDAASPACSGSATPSLAERVMAAVKSAFGKDEAQATPPHPPVHGDHQFSVVRQKDGRLRFFTAWSNNFVDREGEIFTEDAHKEFIEWADRNQQYPELWQWHTKGTKYGQVDWLDYTDGFVFASGLIDAGYEDLAISLTKEDSGVSHGFSGLQRGNEIVSYRSYEISTLPRTNAAVWTTSFNIIGEGAKEMAFTQQKKDYLKAHGLDDAAIAAAEAQATNLSKTLKELGVAYKDSDIIEDPEPPAATTTPVIDTPAVPTEGERAASVAQTQFQTEMLNAINKQNEVLVALAGGMKSIGERVAAVEKTEDEKIAAALTARPAAPVGVAASKDASNVVDEQQNNKDKDFFGQLVSSLAGPTGGA